MNNRAGFLRWFKDPIQVPRIETRVPRSSENCHRFPRIKENRVPSIRENVSLQVHNGYLTFSLKNPCIIANEHTMTLQLNSVNLQLNSIKCKQRVVLCHIGLVKDYGGHLINQPFLSLFDKWLRNNSCRSNKHNEKKTENEWTQNMVKKMYRWKHMPMYIDEWIEFKWRKLVRLEYF